MSVQVGSQEKVRAEERAALMKSLRVLLAENFTDRISMERILDDAHLSVAYIVDAPNAIDRWFKALQNIDSHEGLLKLVDQLLTDFPEENQVLKRLHEIEEEAEAVRRHAQTMETFSSIVDDLAFTEDYIKRLRKPVHLDETVLAELEERMSKLYDLLDKLRPAQIGIIGRKSESTQAGDVEKCANRCIDSLQLYSTLLKYVQQYEETTQIGVTDAPGGLRGHDSDERVLLVAKVALRNALVSLGRAGRRN